MKDNDLIACRRRSASSTANNQGREKDFEEPVSGFPGSNRERKAGLYISVRHIILDHLPADQ